MDTTTEEVKFWLNAEEPNYPNAAAKLGKEALPALESLLYGSDMLLASKALYLSSLIGGELAIKMLKQSATHPDPTIRVAVANAMKNMDEKDFISLLPILGSDADSGVRKSTLRSVAKVKHNVKEALRDIRRKEQNPGLRKIIDGFLAKKE